MYSRSIKKIIVAGVACKVIKEEVGEVDRGYIVYGLRGHDKDFGFY